MKVIGPHAVVGAPEAAPAAIIPPPPRGISEEEAELEIRELEHRDATMRAAVPPTPGVAPDSEVSERLTATSRDSASVHLVPRGLPRDR